MPGIEYEVAMRKKGEWDMFNFISSAYYGKQMYSEPSNGITYSRYSCKNLTVDDAIGEFIEIINGDLEGGYG